LENKKRVSLHKEQETLLIPLFAKAAENSVLKDPKAAEIMSQVDYDFSALHVPEKTVITILLRARKLDETVNAFLSAHPDGTVIHLGCGLDSRCLRVNNTYAHWYDLDYPEVIALRQNFYKETDRYKMIASSVTDFAWMEQIAWPVTAALVVCEGLMMYLKEVQVKNLLLSLQHSNPGCQVIFDTFSKYTADSVQAHPSLHKTGAEVHWGIDDALEIETWASGIYLLEEWFFSQSDAIAGLKPGYRFMFHLAGKIKMANKAHRILYYQL
jgi:O-methyltransferase involved in polyketide biosynthesis